MKPLPYAPRPMAGEGLSSWTARLAAHNFVELPDFWSWLDVSGIEDVQPSVSTINRLAVVTALSDQDVDEVSRRDFSSSKVGATDLVDGGRRGAVCAPCCRAAAMGGLDHWWSAESQSLARVSCPIHQCALGGLENLDLTRTRRGLRLMRGEQVFGAERTAAALDPPLLALEATIAGACVGRSPGAEWRVGSATGLIRAINELVDFVFYSQSGAPFAQLFDTDRTGGGFMFALRPDEPPWGLRRLRAQSVRTRRNALSALAALLLKPAALHGDLAEALRWRSTEQIGGPYWTMIEHVGATARRQLGARAHRLPASVALPVRAALAFAGRELD